MPNADLLFRFLGDAKDLASASKQAKRSLSDVDAGAKKTGGGFKGMFSNAQLLAGGLAAIGATKIVGFLKDAAGAALEDNAAQVQLKQALQNTVGATDDQVAAAEAYIDATARQTGITDNELRPALAELTRSTGDLEQAQTLMGTAMDIATAKGIPLETVVKALGKGAQGNVAAMGRLNLKVRDAEGAFLTFEEAVAEANRTMGGATQAAADSAEGAFRRMNVAVDEAQESIGNALIPVLIDASESANDFAVVAGFLGEQLTAVTGGTDAAKASGDGWFGALLKQTPILGLVVTGAEKAADAIRDAEEAEKNHHTTLDHGKQRWNDQADTIRDATVALEENAEEVRAQMDPTFNLIDATNDLAEAQADVGEARDKYGDGSPEHLAALGKESEAFYDLQAAQLAADGTVSREQYEANLRAMGTQTEHEIDLMMAEFDKLDGRVVDTTIRVNLAGRGASSFADTVSGKKAAGGPVMAGGAYVVGEKGPELLRMGTTSGHITPNDQLGGGGGRSMVNHITINAGMGADPNAISRAIVESLQRYERASGPIPIKTRSA